MGAGDGVFLAESPGGGRGRFHPQGCEKALTDEVVPALARHGGDHLACGQEHDVVVGRYLIFFFILLNPMLILLFKIFFTNFSIILRKILVLRYNRN